MSDGFVPGQVRNLCDFENQPSPYYNEGHRKYRAYVQKVHRELISKYWNGCSGIDIASKKTLPRSFFNDLAKHPAVYMFPCGYPLPPYDEFISEDGCRYKWDPFYSMIFCYETCAAQTGLGAWIHYIALPSLIWFGKQDIHRRVIDQVGNGDKLISLAVSELTGGSDVARLQTTAVRDGDHYIVNGNKYWITGGCRADYFVTAVQTSDKATGQKSGLSLLLIERSPGVFTSKLKLQGAHLNDTAAVTFANVKVPKENLIGVEGQGFRYTMAGFNFERYFLALDMVATMRIAIEDVISWAKERKTFGKPLIKHQVISHKIAEMSRHTMAAHALAEKVAYQLKYDKKGLKDTSIPRNCALLKVTCSNALELVLRECAQILGGRCFVRGGRGKRIEEAWRIVRAGCVAGGASEVMLDFAVRSAKL